MKKSLTKNAFASLGYQAVFWAALFLFGLAQAYNQTSPLGLMEVIIYNACHLLFEILSANLIYRVFILRFLDRKRYALLFICLPVALYLLAVANRSFIVYVAEPFFVNAVPDSLTAILTDLVYLGTHYLFPILTSSFIFICFMHILRYRNEKQISLQLQKEKAELELKVLKSRLNPHFLFNTLNNIYSLSINYPHKTPKYIAGLADMLDHAIYKGAQKMIPIDDEMQVIDRYIELEALRYGNSLKISKTVQMHSPNQVPPLLYLSLVENAFKHGSRDAEGYLHMHIGLQTDSAGSLFSITNSRAPKAFNNHAGIGLKNIEEQLRLYYNQNFGLQIKSDDDWFTVVIKTPANHD